MARPPSDDPQSRITWTSAEKSKVIAQAVETQQKRPELAGLPLIRVAMQVLPVDRRRHLNAIAQVPWFDPALAEAVQRRTVGEKLDAITTKTLIQDHPGDPYTPYLSATRDAVKSQAATTETLVESSAEWRAGAMEFYKGTAEFNKTATALLEMLCIELRSLNEKFAKPAPAQD